MRKVVMVALAAAVVPGLSAAAEWQEQCSNLSGLAETVMEKRQAGVAMSAMMEVAGDKALIQEVVVQAYETPRYSTRRVKRETVQDYRDEWYRYCAKAMR